MNILQRFAQHLTQIEYPKNKTSWHIAGVLPNSNQLHKFDVRNPFQMDTGQLGKRGKTSSKADKMVYEGEKQWIILDVREIHNYIRKHKTKVIHLDDLLTTLEWSILLPK